MKKNSPKAPFFLIREGTSFIFALISFMTVSCIFSLTVKAQFNEGFIKNLQKQEIAEAEEIKSFPAKDDLPDFSESDGKKLWKDIDEARLPENLQASLKPKKYRTLKLNIADFLKAADSAPLEFTSDAVSRNVLLYLPLPDGGYGRFKIVDSPIMSEEMAANFPEIKNFSGQGIDDPNATMRMSWTPKGLNAFVISKNGSFMVAPYSAENKDYYLSYFTRDTENSGFECLTQAAEQIEPRSSSDQSPADNFTGTTLRQYRLVTSATSQFYAFSGGTDQSMVNTMVTLINSVNAIYEREVTIRFIFQGWVVDRAGTTFPASQSPGQLAEINQPLVDGFFGTAGYDVAHVLGFNSSSPSGQVNAFSAVCNASVKAKGATIVTPNLFQSTVVFSHELGHMFNARHTFTPVNGSCLPAADSQGKVEPWSGSTIMSYAGICSPENLQSFNDDYFHVTSMLKIINHTDVAFPSCGFRSATGNSPPTITGANGVNANIPINTPFTLTAFATDPNSDPITFSWEQIDSGNGLPIFRSFYSIGSSSRTFPSLPYILNNGNVPPFSVNGFLTGESLPNSTRTMNFAVSVRDNRSTGGTSAASLQVFVRGEAGPFTVTQPNSNITWAAGSQQTVTWNVANTNLSPINTANVRILLSTDGGQTFPTVLADSTPNDGSQTVTLPANQTATARIKIEAVGNIYFDISNTNFTIGPGACPASPITIGQQINNSLVTTDCVFTGTTRYVDLYSFTGTAGQRIAVSMSSSAFNAYLYLVNSSNQTIGEDDNGGGGTNSRIPANSGYFTLPATGTYTIYATSSLANSTGAYTLSLINEPTCTYSISPASQNFSAAGGTGSISVSTQSGCAWSVSSNAAWISASGSGSGSGSAGFTVSSNSGAARTGTITIAGQTFTVIQAGLSTFKKYFDFDGDGKTDVSIFRPSTGAWWISYSLNNQVNAVQFGTSTDKIAPADFTGDGKTDITIFRESTGQWFVLRSENNTLYGFPFGTSGDKPVPADFDGDGKADPTVYRPSNAGWYSILSSNGSVSTRSFGVAEDVPLPADYDGDGKADLGVFRPSTGAWWTLRSSNGSVFAAQFGSSSDKPNPADFTGDGKVDFAFWRPSNGTWYILRSENSSFYGFPFGTNGDIPVAGDYDGDGKADAAVFRPSNTVWYLQRSAAGFTAVQFGANGDKPVPSAYLP